MPGLLQETQNVRVVPFQYAPLISDVNSESNEVSFNATLLDSAGQGLAA
jgi:hypothetical protein